MNKTQRDKQIAVEASSHRNGLEKVDWLVGGMTNPKRRIYANQYERSFIAGTNSKANLEFIVRQAVEMAREESVVGGIHSIGYEFNIDEIIAVIAKKLEIK